MKNPKFKLFEKVGLTTKTNRTQEQLDSVYNIVGFFVRTGYQFNEWEYLLFQDGWESKGEYANVNSLTVRADDIITLDELKERKLKLAKLELDRAEKFYKECQQKIKDISS